MLNSLIADFALRFYDNIFSLKVILISSLFFISELAIITILLKKKYIKSFVTILSLFIITISILAFLYVRGHKINEIRTNGYVIVYAIDDFKRINNRIPYNKEEFIDFINNRNLNITEVQKQTFYYRYYKSYKGLDSFELSIDDNLLGWSFFKYMGKDNKSLILTDSD